MLSRFEYISYSAEAPYFPTPQLSVYPKIIAMIIIIFAIERIIFVIETAIYNDYTND